MTLTHYPPTRATLGLWDYTNYVETRAQLGQKCPIIFDLVPTICGKFSDDFRLEEGALVFSYEGFNHTQTHRPGRSLIKSTVSLNLRQGRASPVLATGQGKPCTCDRAGQALYLRQGRASPVLVMGQGKPCTCDRAEQEHVTS